MPDPEGRYTLVGTKLPEGELPPCLLFHKWHRYDCFAPESFLDHRRNEIQREQFSREQTGRDYLTEVAAQVQNAGRIHYAEWYRRFADACEALNAEPTITARTSWRMVVGWATNPALEVGLTLDPLYGFPFIPGSAIKGLMHRVAEEELKALVPPPQEGREPGPPEELRVAIGEALFVRALFGSLHLKPGNPDQPSSALVALTSWLRAAHLDSREEPGREAWRDLLPSLETVCSEAPAGGMVTCFDAVPAAGSFTEEGSDPLLTVDVLTPHGESGPNPILFLAVREEASFELRYRLAPWPATHPRDPEEQARAQALAGHRREDVATRTRAWLVRGLQELGVGGKTAGGYGYLHASGLVPRPPSLLPEPPPEMLPGPYEGLSGPDRAARMRLPDDIDCNTAMNYLDDALRGVPSAERSAIARRFVQLFPEVSKHLEGSPAPAKVKRLRLLQGALEDEWGEE